MRPRTLSTPTLFATAAATFIFASATLAQSEYTIPDGTPAYIAAAVNSDVRAADATGRDSGRKPAEVLNLTGIEPGSRVLEFGAFGHYYTTLLSEIVGASGHVYMLDMPWIEPFGGEGARAFAAEHDNASFMQTHYNDADYPDDLDAAMMVLFYHDLLRDDAAQTVDTADLNERVFNALKSGGRYVIIDHRAEDGSGWRDAMTLHRIDAGVIIDEVTAAGFELVENSSLLTNPDDDRTGGIRDPSLRGRTDRALLVFQKP